MNRRSFLRASALAGVALPLGGGASSLRAYADRLAASPFARAVTATDDRVLVILRLDGGADGLNTLVPYHDEEYYRARRRGMSNDLSIHPELVVPLPGSDTLGLHPALAPLLPLFDEQKVAVVQNVGYENTVMSHFRSTEIWMSATDAGEFVGTGWMARSFEREHPEYPVELGEAPYAIEFGTRLSTAFRGDHGDVGMAHTEIDYIPEEPDPSESSPSRVLAERRYIETLMRQSNRYSRSILSAYDKVRLNRVAYPDDFVIEDGRNFSRQLAETARLIAAGLPTRVYLVSLPFYDFHIRQTPREQAQHDAFARSVLAFQRDLEAFGISDRVSMLTMSEFGRRVEAQGTGTDHGGAAPLFVIGDHVMAGFVGHDPDLHNLVGPGNLRMQFDFRQVYASVLGQWFGASRDAMQAALLGRSFGQLPLFRQPTPPVETSDLRLLAEPMPNPASTTVTFRFGQLRSNRSRLRLHAADGRCAVDMEIEVGSEAVTIDIRTLGAGTYFCELVDGDRRAVRRLLVWR